MSTSDVYVSLEFTPNPNTLKYSVNRELLSKGAMNFARREEEAGRSPLAAKLFSIPGIAGVMIGRNFVTVTKTEDGDWDLVHRQCSREIEAHLAANLPVVDEKALEADAHKGGDTQIENRIRQILDEEVRPAVAMDGGDITFERFENGTVYLFLQGSCSGCPSSTATLKVGIETRLRQAIPEVKEVVSV
ncbi:MAG: NifU family protein [Bdellovibrionota bacterium]